jgi:ATP-dependent RNA helicase DDX5/DBP2
MPQGIPQQGYGGPLPHGGRGYDGGGGGYGGGYSGGSYGGGRRY